MSPHAVPAGCRGRLFPGWVSGGPAGAEQQSHRRPRGRGWRARRGQIGERHAVFDTSGIWPRLADVRAARVLQLGARARGVAEGNEPEPAQYKRDQAEGRSHHGIFSSRRCMGAASTVQAGSVPAWCQSRQRLPSRSPQLRYWYRRVQLGQRANRRGANCKYWGARGAAWPRLAR
jgi:hypothetical protein